MMEMPWTTVIKPKDRIFDLELKQIWSKKYLLWLFIKRDITVKFKQTIFGFAWYIIAPVISTAVYVIIFGRMAGIPTDGIPQPLFYLSGICLWNYFSQCIGRCSSIFQSNTGIFGKVYFPRLITPISEVVSHLLRFFIQMALFTVVYIYYVINGVDLRPNRYILLFPLLVFMLAGIAMGVGLMVSSLSTKYRDLKNFFGTFVSLWMYATPVVYPLSVIENPVLKRLMLVNPITSIIETFKYGTMGAGIFNWGALTYSFIFMSIVLLVGSLMFNRKQKLFIDTI